MKIEPHLAVRKPCVVIILLVGICMIAFPGHLKSQQEANASLFPTWLAVRDIESQHLDLLDARLSELDHELNYYNYPGTHDKAFDFVEAHSPLVKNHLMFRFVFFEGHASAFMAIFPIQGAGVKIVPIAYGGIYPGSEMEQDPHNIAIFNSMMAAEVPELQNDADRIRLAILYLSLFDQHPQIVGTENEATRGSIEKFEPEVSRRLIPSVTPDPNGEFTVLAFATTGDRAKFDEFSLSFDRVGMLRAVWHDVRTLQYILRK